MIRQTIPSPRPLLTPAHRHPNTHQRQQLLARAFSSVIQDTPTFSPFPQALAHRQIPNLRWHRRISSAAACAVRASFAQKPGTPVQALHQSASQDRQVSKAQSVIQLPMKYSLRECVCASNPVEEESATHAL
jgi:hypothetical protein